MQLYAMNMNLMAEKIFVVVEFGVKEKYDRCYSSSRKKLYFLLICIMSKTNGEFKCFV